MQLNTFKEYSMEWLHVKKLSIKQSTYQRYNDCLLQHIYPYFGSLAIHQIDQEKIYCFFELKSEELGASRLKIIKYFLQAVLLKHIRCILNIYSLTEVLKINA